MNTIKITEQPNKKTSELLKMLRDKFPVYSYYSDSEFDKQFPAPKEATERYFLDSPKPDEDTLGLSVLEAAAKGCISGITLRERLLYELAYFEIHGIHPDTDGVTFCSGSRGSGGYVPGVVWYSDDQGVRVNWYDLDNSDSEYGLRSAVTLDSSLTLESLNARIKKLETIVEKFGEILK